MPALTGYQTQALQPTRRRNPYDPGVPLSPEAVTQQRTQAAQSVASQFLSPVPFGGNINPSPYPDIQGQFFEPRVAPTPQRPPNPRTVDRYLNPIFERQTALAGPLAGVLPLSPQRPLTAGDIPLLEAGLNYEQLLQTERDRQRSFEELSRARQQIGFGRGADFARQQATIQAQQGPIDEELEGRNVTRIREGAGRALEAARRSAASQIGSQGLTGSSIGAFRLADLEQQGRQQAESDITDFLTQSAQVNRAAQAEGLSRLSEIVAREEGGRLLLDQEIARLFGDTERGPISLAGLIPQIPKNVRAPKAKQAI